MCTIWQGRMSVFVLLVNVVIAHDAAITSKRQPWRTDKIEIKSSTFVRKKMN